MRYSPGLIGSLACAIFPMWRLDVRKTQGAKVSSRLRYTPSFVPFIALHHFWTGDDPGPLVWQAISAKNFLVRIWDIDGCLSAERPAIITTTVSVLRLQQYFQPCIG